MASNNLQYTLSLRDLFTRTMNGAANATANLDNRMNSLRSGIASLGAGIGVVALTKGIIETGSSFERAEIQLKTLLKSSSEAKAVFNDLKNEATKSPFGFETLLQGNAALISTGISAKDAKEDFNALANAIAATGGTEDTLQRMVFNLQQIKNTGKATGVDIKQFGMAGINVFAILDEYYKKNHISLSKQKGDYAEITGALKLAASEGGRYFGALDNLANSSSGKLSNLADSFKNFQYELFNKLKPTIDSVVSGLTGLMSWVVKNIDSIMRFAKTIGTLIVVWKTYQAVLWTVRAAQTALNVAMLANPLGIVAAAVAVLAAGLVYLNSLIDETLEKASKSYDSGVKQEINNVNALMNAHKGLNQEQAIGMERQRIQKEMANNQEATRQALGIGGFSTDKDKMRSLAATKNELEGQLAVLNNPNLLSDGLGKMKKGVGKAAPAGSKEGAAKMGTGVEVTGNRPQNLYITINDGLVHEMNIHSTTIQESYPQIKANVSKALLETLNDANKMER